jgi:hypothetical protein
MGLMKWDESPHWRQQHESTTATLEEELFVEAELPTLTTPRTMKEITEAIMDDPRYNSINPSNQQHIITRAVSLARESGMLIADIT